MENNDLLKEIWKNIETGENGSQIRKYKKLMKKTSPELKEQLKYAILILQRIEDLKQKAKQTNSRKDKLKLGMFLFTLFLASSLTTHANVQIKGDDITLGTAKISSIGDKVSVGDLHIGHTEGEGELCIHDRGIPTPDTGFQLYARNNTGEWVWWTQTPEGLNRPLAIQNTSVNFNSVTVNGSAISGGLWSESNGNISYVDGSVGIGETMPTALLHIQENDAGSAEPYDAQLGIENKDYTRISMISGTDDFGQLTFGDANDVNVGYVHYGHNGDFMMFATGNTGEKMRITSIGNVGIGESNPGEKLHVDGNIKVTSGNDVCIEGGNCLSNVSGGLSNSSDWNRSGTTVFLSNINDKVGIGTEIPLAKLDVQAGSDPLILFLGSANAYPEISISGTGSNQHEGITFRDGATQKAVIGYDEANEMFTIGGSLIANDDYLVVKTQGASVGNVGIGTTNPGQLLQLGGNGGSNGTMRFEASDGDEVDMGITTDDELYITGGNVGIRTNNPEYELDVSGINVVIKVGDSNDDNQERVLLWAATNGGAIDLFNTTESNTVKIRSYASAGVQAYFTAGNIGIGTKNPSNELEVNGNIELTNLYDNDASNFFDGGCSADQYISGIDSTGAITCAGDSGTGSMSSFTLAGTSGSAQTITQGNTVLIEAGTGITTTGASTDKVTIVSTLGTAIEYGEITATTSANWAGKVTDETGTGKMVFATNPTFLTGINVPANSISDDELDESASFEWGNVHSFAGAITMASGTNINFVDSGTYIDGTVSAITIESDNDLTINADYWINIDSNTLYINALNNLVGIGTNTPSSLLQVGGDVDGEIRVVSDAGRMAVLEADDSGNWIHVGSLSSHDFAIVRNDVTKIYLDDNGIGFGTTSPVEEHDVRGAVIASDGFATKLWDVSGGHFETATTDVEYYSPNQHGSIYGTVYREYFGVVTNNEVIVNVGINGLLLDTKFHIKHVASNWEQAVDDASYSSTYRARIIKKLAAGAGQYDLTVHVGSGYTVKSGWVDYTKS